MRLVTLLAFLLIPLLILGCGGGGAAGNGEEDEEPAPDESLPPNAAFDILTPADEIVVGASILFDASASDDGEGSDKIAHYIWDFDFEEARGFAPDKRSTDPRTTRIFYYPGPYTVALIVIDNDDLTSEPALEDLTVADAGGAVIIVE